MVIEKTKRNLRRAGRKPVAPEEKYKSRNIKFTDAEWELVKELAVANGVSASEYIRNKSLKSKN